jgi:hypothetical protein
MPQKIDVVCYAGYKANEKPMKFIFENKEFHIKKILDRSIRESLTERDRVYRFKVLCTDNKTYSIFYNSRMEQWFLEEKG